MQTLQWEWDEIKHRKILTQSLEKNDYWLDVNSCIVIVTYSLPQQDCSSIKEMGRSLKWQCQLDVIVWKVSFASYSRSVIQIVPTSSFIRPAFIPPPLPLPPPLLPLLLLPSDSRGDVDEGDGLCLGVLL